MEIVDGTDKCPALVINTNKVANLLEINDCNLLQMILLMFYRCLPHARHALDMC